MKIFGFLIIFFVILSCSMPEPDPSTRGYNLGTYNKIIASEGSVLFINGSGPYNPKNIMERFNSIANSKCKEFGKYAVYKNTTYHKASAFRKASWPEMHVLFECKK